MFPFGLVFYCLCIITVPILWYCWAIFLCRWFSDLRRGIPFLSSPSPATFPRLISARVCVGALFLRTDLVFWFAASEYLAVRWVRLHELLLSDLLLVFSLLHLSPPICFPLTQSGYFWPEKLEASPTHESRSSVFYPFCRNPFTPPITILVAIRCLVFHLRSISDFVLFLCRFKPGTIHGSIWSFLVHF